MTPNQDEITLSRLTVIRVLSAIALFLLVASVAGQVAKYGFGHDTVYGLIRLTYVDKEMNIPTFFSSILLFLASLLLALITVLKRAVRDAYWYHWAGLSLILLYMAADETSLIHEMMNNAGWSLTGHGTGTRHYGWVAIAIPIVAVVALAYLKFFLHLPAQTQRQFFAAAAIFVGGAIGVEIPEGYYAASHGEENFQFSLFPTVEEGLEMAGVIVSINALLTYVINHYNVRIRFDHSPKSS